MNIVESSEDAARGTLGSLDEERRVLIQAEPNPKVWADTLGVEVMKGMLGIATEFLEPEVRNGERPLPGEFALQRLQVRAAAVDPMNQPVRAGLAGDTPHTAHQFVQREAVPSLAIANPIAHVRPFPCSGCPLFSDLVAPR